jgi:glycosyltransferase involved in cell wall biosynthesis
MLDGECLRLVWMGPLQGEHSLLHGTAPHPATMRWQRTYIGGLRQAGVRTHWIGHDPHRTWPWGPLFATSGHARVDDDASAVPYANAPLVRTRSLTRGYVRRVVQAVRSIDANALVTYNVGPSITAAASAAAGEGVPWIPIVLDFHDPSRDGWESFRAATAGAAGVAFVSHWAFERAPVPRRFLLPPAIVPRGPTAPPVAAPRRTIFYAGARSRAGGVDRLIAAMALLRTPDVQLVMTGQGRGYDRDIARMTADSDRVTDLGMVTEAELERLALSADVLVNPRPVRSDDSCMNFPSKVLDYMSYGRPIVSTRAPGLGPAFDDVLVFSEGDEPRQLAEAIDRVLGWSPAERSRFAERCGSFADRSSATAAAREFAGWISDLVGSSCVTEQSDA